MSPETQQLTSKALSLIEQSRYRMGTSRFVEAFIDQWAYLQTGLYPAKEEIPEELQPVAFELSHVLSAAIKRDPTSDVFGLRPKHVWLPQEGHQLLPHSSRDWPLDVTHCWLTVFGRLL